MAVRALIFGRSKSGKSTSLETLNPDTTFIINIADKPLPFEGWEDIYKPFNSKDKTGNIVSVSEVKHIVAVMDIVDKELPHIETLILEDYQYMSGFKFMNKISDRGFEKFNEIAHDIFVTAMEKPKSMRKDLVVFYLNHEESESNDTGVTKVKAKTCGKLIDNLITLEGLFTSVLRSNTKKTKEGVQYFFETQTDGITTVGTPRGMFKDPEIPNDLEFVRKTMLGYSKKIKSDTI